MTPRARRVLRFDPRHPEDWLAWGLRAALVAVALAGLAGAFHLEHATGASLAAAAAMGLAAGAVVAGTHATRPRLVRAGEVALLAIFALHAVGHVGGLYLHPYYDVLLHASAGVLGGFVAFGLVTGTTAIWGPGERTPLRAFLAVLAIVTMGGVAVELAEFGSDALLGTREQWDPVQDGLTDTMTDVLAQTVTGTVVASLAAFAASRDPARLGAPGPRPFLTVPTAHVPARAPRDAPAGRRAPRTPLSRHASR